MTKFRFPCLQAHHHRALTAITNLGLLLVLYHYGLGGWQNTLLLLSQYGWLPRLMLLAVCFLLFFRSDYRSDLVLFAAGLALGYWGEWWGTTRGVWAYWNGATPPAYLPPLWGLGLLTAYRLSRLFLPLINRIFPRPVNRTARWIISGFFIGLPALTWLNSWSLLARVDWRGRLDLHFAAGLLVAAVLLVSGFDWQETFLLYLSGILLGGAYEALGTAWGEWAYITGEVPPLWIAPLWGYAVVAMVQLARLPSPLIRRLSHPQAIEYTQPGSDKASQSPLA
jgi:hypothetical protein